MTTTAQRRVRERPASEYRAAPDEPRWLTRQIVDMLHDERLAQHGGLAGVSSENPIESALARPQNLFAYVGGDLPRLAAAYAFGLATGVLDEEAFAEWLRARRAAPNGLTPGSRLGRRETKGDERA